MRTRMRLISVIVFMALVLSACSPATTFLSLKDLGQSSAAAQAEVKPAAQASTQVPAAQIAPSDAVAALEGTLTAVYEKVSPSVVNITVTSQVQQSSMQLPFGFMNPGSQQDTPQYSQGEGSGFVWDSDGHILTNAHVVDGATKITVTFADGYAVPGKVVGRDVNSDLAVVKVDVAKDKLVPVALGDSSSVKVGEVAVAIGNPFGLQGSMTMGIISALGRSLPVESGTSGSSYTIPDVIQTDAPINPGNSGGPLVNDQGEVVGITTAIESPVRANSGVGFVVPINTVKRVAPELIKNGSYSYSWMGISGTSLSYELNQALEINTEQRGILVIEVTAGGPAEKAGLRGSDKEITVDGASVRVGGDIITAIDGRPLNTFDQMVSYLVQNTSVGDKVTLTALRDGKETKLDLTLAARPQQTAAVSGGAQGREQSSAVWLGITGVTVSPELSKAAGLEESTSGVLLQEVQADSPADKAGLRGGSRLVEVNGEQILTGGDVIQKIDGKSVENISSLRELLAGYTAGQKVVVDLLRDGKPLSVEVTLEKRPAN